MACLTCTVEAIVSPAVPNDTYMSPIHLLYVKLRDEVNFSEILGPQP
jgi:hypothetical protein